MIYLTNGNMPLNAAYADEIVQEDNSTYQLSFRFPTSDPLWEKLKEETFLTADDLHGEQDFVIFEVEKKHGYIQVYANQVFTLLNNYVVNPISLDRQTGSTALSRFAGSITRYNPFSFFSDIEDRHTFNIGSKNAMEAFAKDKHSIIGQWGGDLVRHGYQVRLLKNGGSENESLFMYKKNLSSYQHKTSTKSLKTRITFTTTVKGEGEKAPDRTFTVTIDSPLINKYSQIYEDVIEVNDQDVKDEASLRKYGEQYYRTSLCDMMEDSLEIEVVGQSDVPVQMFDIVSLFHEVYNLDVRKKITKYTYSPMAKKLKSIGFGQFQSGLASAIGNAVSDAVKGEAQQFQGNFERQLARELKNADLSFDRRKEELVNQFTDDVNAIKAKSEETKQEIINYTDQTISQFSESISNSVQALTNEALDKAGASTLLAQEAKRIGLDSIARLEEFKRQATSAQTALSGDLDVLKRTVTSEVNQASEHRRTTTEALSRMTGQMNGFATKSEVAQGIDGLTQTFAKMKIGGRNLIRNYDWDKWLPLSSFSVGWKFERVEDQLAKSGYILKATCTKAGNGGFYKTLFDLRSDEFQGKDMTWSWDMKSSRPITFYDMGFEAGGLKKNVSVSTEWERISSAFKVAFNRFYSCVFYANRWEVGDVVYIRDPQLEEGTVATTPRPAPEDGKDEILAAKTEFKQTADGLSTRMATVENYVNQDGQRQDALQRYTREESARQVSAVREQISREYVGKSTYQEDVRGIERKFEGITNPKNGSIATQIANYKNSVDGRFTEITLLLSGKANQTDFQRVKETSQLYERILGSTDNGIADNIARMAVTNQLFQVEVSKASASGRNLFLNSLFKRDLRDRYSTYKLYDDNTQTKGQLAVSIDSDNQFRGVNTLKIVSTFNGKIDNQKITFDIGGNSRTGRDDELKNKSARFSFWAKSTVANTKFYARSGYRGWGREIPISTDWKFYDVEFVTNENLKATSELILHVFTAATVWIAFPKIEIGTVATPFTEAPEDTDEAIRTVQSQLAGSWAVQNLTSAGSIVSQINATNNQILIEAEKIRLKGKTLLDELTAIQGYFKRLFVGEGTFATLNADVIRTNSITADKLVFNEALANRMVSNEHITSKLVTSRAFVNALKTVTIDASQIVTGTLTGDRIYGGTIRGAEINGTRITGDSRITIGDNGFLRPTQYGGLQINVPETYNANKGVGIQIFGRKLGVVPKGMFIYNAPSWVGGDFEVGESVSDTLLTVKGLTSLCNLFDGKPMSGLPINSNFSFGFPVPELFRVSFIAWDARIGQLMVNDGTNTKGTWWFKPDLSTSDKSLKTNIQNTDFEATDFVKKLEFKQFDWKPDKFGYKKPYTNVGLIAQDVEKLDSSLVYPQGENLALDDFRLGNIALKAIQELSQRIETLERKLA